MKRLLLTLLVLVMLVPTVACVGNFCVGKMSQHCPNCPKETGAKIFKSCCKDRVQALADHVTLKQPVAQAHALFAIVAVMMMTGLSTAAAMNGSRAPPGRSRCSYPPPYLSTLRLRI